MSNGIDNTGFRRIAMGYAIENLKDNDLYLHVHILELISTEDITYKEKKEKSKKPKQSLLGGISKGAVLKCRYYNKGSNTITAPTVRKGELIEVYQFADTDQFFWRTSFYEHEIRGHEVKLEVFSNIDKDKNPKKHLEKVDKNKSYYNVVDTKGKKVKTHTSKNDGEPVGWDFGVDTKKGLYSIRNSAGTYIEAGINHVKIHAKTITLDADKIIINGKTSIILKTPRGVYDIGNLSIKGGTVNYTSSIKFGASTNFTASVRMNKNAKTKDGSKVL